MKEIWDKKQRLSLCDLQRICENKSTTFQYFPYIVMAIGKILSNFARKIFNVPSYGILLRQEKFLKL